MKSGDDRDVRCPPILAGAESRAHPGRGPVGLLLIHGYTGTPASMAPLADAAVAADIPMELPLLAGHGYDVADLETVVWDDWMADVARAAERLGERTDTIVVCGQSMGGALALAIALDTDRPPIGGLVCINPLTMPRSAQEMELIDGLIEDGIEVAPGGDADIADPDARDLGYAGTPLRALRSALVDGITPISARYGELAMPLLLWTSRQDHVVEPANSEYLAATYGGPVDHVWLERSFHVAAIDFDRTEIAGATMQFLSRVSP